MTRLWIPFLAVLSIGSAQQVTVSGKVIDFVTKSGINGATVELVLPPSSRRSTVTAPDGSFSFGKVVVVQMSEIDVSQLGYSPNPCKKPLKSIRESPLEIRLLPTTADAGYLRQAVQEVAAATTNQSDLLEVLNSADMSAGQHAILGQELQRLANSPTGALSPQLRAALNDASARQFAAVVREQHPEPQQMQRLQLYAGPPPATTGPGNDIEAVERARAAELERLRTERERLALAEAQAARAKAEAEAARARAEAQAASMQADAARAKAAAEAQRARADAQARTAVEAEARAGGTPKFSSKDAARERLRQDLNSVFETRETARGLIVNISDALFDLYDLKSGAREKMGRVAGILLAYPGLNIQVEGYTDSVGSDQSLRNLSRLRADSIRQDLISQGLTPERITAVAYGQSRPVASNETAAGRQMNRRVELVISGDIIGIDAGVTAPMKE